MPPLHVMYLCCPQCVGEGGAHANVVVGRSLCCVVSCCCCCDRQSPMPVAANEATCHTTPQLQQDRTCMRQNAATRSSSNSNSILSCSVLAHLLPLSGDSKGAQVLRESTRRREAYFLVYCREVMQALRAEREKNQTQTEQEQGDNDNANQTTATATAKVAGKNEAPQTQTHMLVMLTGGFRALRTMRNALGNGDCDLIGLGRPLCGQPHCVNRLLEADAGMWIGRRSRGWIEACMHACSVCRCLA